MNKLFLFVLGISFIACTEITFKEPQPKGIKALREFPGALQGRYIVRQDSASTIFDTVYIEAIRYRINSIINEGDWMNRGVLSDSLVLKNYKGFYYLNFYTDEQWIVRVFKQEKNGNVSLNQI